MQLKFLMEGMGMSHSKVVEHLREMLADTKQLVEEHEFKAAHVMLNSIRKIIEEMEELEGISYEKHNSVSADH